MGKQIIDFDRKGNVIRFFLGENGNQWGDDWNDRPYDCNAGEVYDRYIDGTFDVCVPYDWEVLEPSDGVLNCRYSKEDMMRRRVPCMIFIPPSMLSGHYFFGEFDRFVGSDDVIRVYFGDTVEHITTSMRAADCSMSA